MGRGKEREKKTGPHKLVHGTFIKVNPFANKIAMHFCTSWTINCFIRLFFSCYIDVFYLSFLLNFVPISIGFSAVSSFIVRCDTSTHSPFLPAGSLTGVPIQFPDLNFNFTTVTRAAKKARPTGLKSLRTRWKRYFNKIWGTTLLFSKGFFRSERKWHSFFSDHLLKRLLSHLSLSSLSLRLVAKNGTTGEVWVNCRSLETRLVASFTFLQWSP